MLKKTFILFTILSSLTFFSCEKEEIFTTSFSEKAVNLEFETVKLEEAKQIFYSSQSSKSSKTSKQLELSPLWDLSYEGNEVSDNYLLLPVFLNLNNNDNVYSRVIFRKSGKNNIESIVFTQIFNDTNNGKSFNGEIYFHSLSGKYLAGYRIKEGEIVSEFKERNTSSNNSRGGDDCTSPGCELGQGEEVVVYGSSGGGSTFYGSGWVDPTITELDAGPSGGGGGVGFAVPCSSLFKFNSVTSGDSWQESQINNLTQKLAYSGSLGWYLTTMEIPSIVFGLPLNVGGTTIFSSNQAKEFAGFALYAALTDLRRYFKSNPTFFPVHYRNYFMKQLDNAFKALTGGSGRVNANSSINPVVQANSQNYVPCT